MNRSFLAHVMFLALSLMLVEVKATHVIGGEIIARRIDNVSLSYEITFIGYGNLDSSIEFGHGVLRTGDGEVYNGPFTFTQIQIDNQIQRVSFTVIHTFKGPSAAGYIISFEEDFRDSNIVNINNGNSVQIPFYVETKLVIDPFLGSNSTPVLNNPPEVWAQAEKAYQANPGAYDPDGDLLTYRIAEVQRTHRATVGGYQSPNDPSFYLNHEQGNEAGNGPPIFDIDRFTGVLTWDAPSLLTDNCDWDVKYSIAIAVDEWRNVRGNWYKMGYVVRDYNIKIDHCKENQPPELPNLADTCVTIGDQLTKEIVAFSPDGDPLIYRADGEPLELPNSAEYTAGTSLQFDWTPTCDDIRQEPYTVYFRATDNIFRGPALASVSTLSIHVSGPEVTGLNIQDESPGTISLSWDPYYCPNADSLEVWRKEGPFAGEKCELINPEEMGFQLIGKVPINQLAFTDNSVSPEKNSGDYTYHLKATFKSNRGNPDELYEVLTGINESRKKINIYPNPTNSSVFIKPVMEAKGYQLYDLSGKLLHQGEVNASGEIGSLDLLNDGMYVLVLLDRSEKIMVSERLIIRK